jgi:hypothetical protein
MSLKRKHTINHTLPKANITVLCLFCAATMSSCNIFKHNGLNSGNAMGPAPSAQQLISTFQQHVLSVTSVHVVMQAQNTDPTDYNEQITIDAPQT